MNDFCVIFLRESQHKAPMIVCWKCMFDRPLIDATSDSFSFSKFEFMFCERIKKTNQIENIYSIQFGISLVFVLSFFYLVRYYVNLIIKYIQHRNGINNILNFDSLAVACNYRHHHRRRRHGCVKDTETEIEKERAQPA